MYKHRITPVLCPLSNVHGNLLVADGSELDLFYEGRTESHELQFL